ncbi:MAG: PilZ domain-containing protein [Sedimentisphaerales bacterium]|nr:PilZ domain-containing protein [Sedimentisphaerales bacterium]
MENILERRREQRLRYQWPVWFAEDFQGLLYQGQMVDVSSTGAAFTCFARGCPYPGQQITARINVPYYHSDASFDVNEFIQAGSVCRIDHLPNGLRRIAIKFFHPLPYKPGEHANKQFEAPLFTGAAMM